MQAQACVCGLVLPKCIAPPPGGTRCTWGGAGTSPGGRLCRAPTTHLTRPVGVGVWDRGGRLAGFKASCFVKKLCLIQQPSPEGLTAASATVPPGGGPVVEAAGNRPPCLRSTPPWRSKGGQRVGAQEPSGAPLAEQGGHCGGGRYVPDRPRALPPRIFLILRRGGICPPRREAFAC